jgi:hypothetical protein
MVLLIPENVRDHSRDFRRRPQMANEVAILEDRTAMPGHSIDAHRDAGAEGQHGAPQRLRAVALAQQMKVIPQYAPIHDPE